MLDDVVSAQILGWALDALGWLPQSAVDGPQRAMLAIVSLYGVFVIKHFVCDFLFQTNWQAANKGRYGHPASFAHSGQHALGSLVVLYGLAPGLYAAMVAGETFLHYHLDWLKDGITKRAGWTVKDHAFWIALGFDQMMHHLTYVGIVAILVCQL